MVAWLSGDYLRGLMVVTAVLLSFILFSLTPAPLGLTMPFWGLIPLYFFSLRRSQYLPAWLLFIAGFIIDALQGLPLGMHPILFIAFHYGLKSFAKHFQRKSIWQYWLGFIICSLGYWTIARMFFLVLSGHSLELELVLVPWLATSIFYPMLHLLLSRLLPLIPAVR